MKSVSKAKDTTDALKFRPHEEILPLSSIELSKDNDFALNDTPEEIQELAESIRINGLMHPLVINRVDGVNRLISGERRCKALWILGYDNIRCTVYNDISYAAEIRMLYEANLKSRSYTAAEKLQFYEKLKNILLEQKEKGEYEGPIQMGVAKLMGITDRQARKYDRISQNLGEEDKQRLSQGQISVNEAYEKVKEPPLQQGEKRNIGIETGTGSGFSKDMSGSTDARYPMTGTGSGFGEEISGLPDAGHHATGTSSGFGGESPRPSINGRLTTGTGSGSSPELYEAVTRALESSEELLKLLPSTGDGEIIRNLLKQLIPLLILAKS